MFQPLVPPDTPLPWWADLNTTEVATLAVAVSAVSLVVTATSTFIVTYMSGWNARRLARDEALRKYRLEMLTPALAEAEEWIEKINGVRAGEDIEVLVAGGPPSFRVVRVTPDQQLEDAAGLFAVWRRLAWRILKDARREDLTDSERTWLLDRLWYTAYAFREALENQVFGDEWDKATAAKVRGYDEAHRPKLVTLVMAITARRAGLTDDASEADLVRVNQVRGDWPFGKDTIPPPVDP